jgi:two-component system chemotaxis sensor kinase CheA
MGTAEFPVAMPAAMPVAPEDSASSRLVRVRIRRDAVMRGGRATIALRKAEALGRVDGVRPAVAAFERDDFEGGFSFRFEGDVDDAALEAAIRSAGDIDAVTIGDAPVHAEVAAAGAGGARRHIRVDLERLDVLMNVMGELVVARGRLTEIATGSASLELEAVSARIARLVNTLQGEVIAVRLTPVWQVFDRYPRVIRDLARQLGKRVDFQIEGGDIELDRAILDEMGDPLLHLLRNAVDHGIESARDREAAGKPATGRIVLSAARDRQGVAIRVADDGRGIDRERVLARARKEGLVEPEARGLTDDQLLRILSRAGFSTAEQVTDVSGRGVGVDAVLSRVRQLGGRVSLQTDPGRGTTVTLQLPVTLAVLKVLLAGVGEERYAVPLSHVSETVEFDPGRVTSLGGREALVLRETVIPTRHLRDVLAVPASAVSGNGRRPTIILEAGDRRTALVVDRLLGQQEIVVEAFDAPRGMLPVFSGATILGDGHPALILDAAALT